MICISLEELLTNLTVPTICTTISPHLAELIKQEPDWELLCYIDNNLDLYHRAEWDRRNASPVYVISKEELTKRFIEAANSANMEECQRIRQQMKELGYV